jgi:hypothetical protein
MSRKGKIINVTNGVLNSFISRNNSINGYWGIGKICKYLITSNEGQMKIKLIPREDNFSEPEMGNMINYFSLLFYKNLAVSKVQSDIIKEVNFEITSTKLLSEIDENELRVTIYAKCEAYDIIFSKVVCCYKHRAIR